jgi:hypothetical protein
MGIGYTVPEATVRCGDLIFTLWGEDEKYAL